MRSPQAPSFYGGVTVTLLLLFLPTILFLSADTFNWGMGWCYVGVTIAIALVSWIIIIRTSPELLKECSQFLKAEGVKDWDKIIAPLVALGEPLAISIVAGLDLRWDWSPEFTLTLQLLALTITLLGYAVVIWAVPVNRFLSAVARIQTDRDRTLLTQEPYRFVPHPGYLGVIASYLATPIALGSLWGLIPAILTVLLLLLLIPLSFIITKGDRVQVAQIS
jgi:protein-S-isoprenylcysteine O-methyltransferase Ste14